MWKWQHTAKKKALIRVLTIGTLTLLILLALGFSFVLWSQKQAYTQFASQQQGSETPDPFPLGVDPSTQRITEQPAAESFYRRHIAGTLHEPTRPGWFAQKFRALGHMAWLQNLATPASRILVIEPGERQEQVVDNFGDILHWSNVQRDRFRTLVASSTATLHDGIFFPGRYVVAADATPEFVAQEVSAAFAHEVRARYTPTIDATVPLRDALTIASLLEREAYSFEDMRNISGIIWNRLFIDMPLQLDASLQYVKGSRPYGPWWPKVTPSDKFLSSPFNTYQNKGLPPSPIANPSLAAIVAALNPRVTDCLFYFHNAEGDFFCAENYEEHVELLRQEYGRGR